MAIPLGFLHILASGFSIVTRIFFAIFFPVFLSIILSFVACPSHAETSKAEKPQVAVDWIREARHLVGGGDHLGPRAAAKLKAWPGLDTALRAALKTPDRFLALDVITALRREQLLEDLVTIGPQDVTGLTYLAINTFITDRNVSRFASMYAQLLADPRTSLATQVILLDSLSRMNIKLDPRQLDHLLFQTTDPEVHSAAISFLRQSLKTNSDVADQQRLRKLLAMETLSDQRKIQVLFVANELVQKADQDIGKAQWSCPEKIPTTLRKFCPRGTEP